MTFFVLDSAPRTYRSFHDEPGAASGPLRWLSSPPTSTYAGPFSMPGTPPSPGMLEPCGTMSPLPERYTGSCDCESPGGAAPGAASPWVATSLLGALAGLAGATPLTGAVGAAGEELCAAQDRLASTAIPSAIASTRASRWIRALIGRHP